MKAYATAVALLLIIFGSIGGYLYQRFSAFANSDFTPPPVTVAASLARVDTWNETLNAVGTIQAVRGIELTSETSGEITELRFASGDHVTAGAVLVVLNNKEESASRRNQEATLELSELLFDRDRTLIERQTIPQTQFDRTRADLERARAQLAETEARLDNKRIEAPFSGTIGISRVDVGDYIAPGTVIATLQDQSELEIDFTVPARYSPQLRPGLKANVRVDAFPDRSFAATIIAVDARVDPDTRNVLVRARLDDADGVLPGMFAELDIDLGEHTRVVTIPETAMTYSLQGNTVYVVESTEGGALTATPRVVRAGKVRDGRIAVLEGIADGEQVVSVGQNKLYRGVRIVLDPNVTL